MLTLLLAATTAHAEITCYGMGCQNSYGVEMEPPAYQPEPDPTPAAVQPNPLYPTAGTSCNFHTDCSPGERCIKRPLDLTGTCR
jgi:hypothetical protein